MAAGEVLKTTQLPSISATDTFGLRDELQNVCLGLSPVSAGPQHRFSTGWLAGLAGGRSCHGLFFAFLVALESASPCFRHESNDLATAILHL